jgi:hypothetical protein
MLVPSVSHTYSRILTSLTSEWGVFFSFFFLSLDIKIVKTWTDQFPAHSGFDWGEKKLRKRKLNVWEIFH